MTDMVTIHTCRECGEVLLDWELKEYGGDYCNAGYDVHQCTQQVFDALYKHWKGNSRIATIEAQREADAEVEPDLYRVVLKREFRSEYTAPLYVAAESAEKALETARDVYSVSNLFEVIDQFEEEDGHDQSEGNVSMVSAELVRVKPTHKSMEKIGILHEHGWPFSLDQFAAQFREPNEEEAEKIARGTWV